MLEARGGSFLRIGKSGHIGAQDRGDARLHAPALYVHPAEASHGDLGMITAEDVVLLLQLRETPSSPTSSPIPGASPFR